MIQTNKEIDMRMGGGQGFPKVFVNLVDEGRETEMNETCKKGIYLLEAAEKRHAGRRCWKVRRSW